jgi:hypothetical protein
MSPEEIVTAYKTSVRLKRAGIDLYDSVFIWAWEEVEGITKEIPVLGLRLAQPRKGSWTHIVNAYTLSELIHALPLMYADCFGSYPVNPGNSIEESIERAVEALIHFIGKEEGKHE